MSYQAVQLLDGSAGERAKARFSVLLMARGAAVP